MNIGIMGGTFDPVHNAHLSIASQVCNLCSLDKVFLMPTSIPPHKINRNISSVQHRLAMLNLAVEDYPCLEVSTVELDRTGTTYAIDTLEHLVAKEEGVNYFYIIGADVVFDLLNWKDCKKVFQLCSFIALMRQGYERCLFDAKIKELRNVYGVKISCVEVPLIDISSTFVRNCFAEFTGLESNQAKDNLAYKKVPKKVFEYILNNKLYR